MTITKNASLSAMLCNIELLPISDIKGIMEVSPTIKNVHVVDGKSWTTFPFSSGTTEYSQEQKQAEAGTFFQHQVKMFIQGDSYESQEVFSNFHNIEFIVRITLMSGIKLLLGSADVPVFFQINYNTAKGGREISFTWASPLPAFGVED